MKPEHYPLIAAAIHLVVAVLRKRGLAARYGAPVAIALGALAGLADALANGVEPLSAVVAGLGAGAAAVAAHELGEASRGRYVP